MVSWAPPAYGRPPGPAPGLRYGSVFARVVAWFADGLALASVGIAIEWMLGLFASQDLLPVLLSSVLGVGFSILYFVGFWTGPWRATPAMRLLGLQVANSADGLTLTVRQGLIRWAVLEGVSAVIGLLAALVADGATTSVGLLVDLWVLVLFVSTVTGQAKQGLHDRAADSIVSQPEGASSGAACALLVAIVVACVVLGLVLVAILGPQIQQILSDVGSSI